MKHWQTTAAGILTIIGTLAAAGTQFFTGHPVSWETVLAGVTAGIGLIRAADSSKVDQIPSGK